MGNSSRCGKAWIAQEVDFIASRQTVNRVLDIGAGEGTYSDLFRNSLPSFWTAVEIWQPYIDQYQLHTKYNQVICENARFVDYGKLGHYQIAFAGDVLEHMIKEHSVELVNRILDTVNYLIVSIPIVHMPQGIANNNPFEVHLKDDWSNEEMLQTFGHLCVAYHCDEDIGVYILTKSQSAAKNYLVAAAEQALQNSQFQHSVQLLEKYLCFAGAESDLERSAIMRKISRCYGYLLDQQRAQHWAWQAVHTCSDDASVYLELTRAAHFNGDFHASFYAAEKYIAMEPMENHGYEVYDFSAVSAYQLGYIETAARRGQRAVQLCPNDSRIRSNAEFYFMRCREAIKDFPL